MRLIIVRKYWLIRFFIILVSIIVLIVSLSYNKYVATSNIPTMPKIIAIDPGHGGFDPGKLGDSGQDEKHINLAISLYLRDYLRQNGYIVTMTRDKDIDLYADDGSGRKMKTIDLTNRKNIVIKDKPDIFICLHVNSFPESKYYGAQTFYSKDKEESKELAIIIQEELVKSLDNNNKRQALEKNDVYMIKGLDMPAVLIECGFLSNPQEEQRLNDPQYQQKIAWSIYVGLEGYFKRSFQE